MTAALLVPIILIFGRFLQFGSSITFNDVGQGDSILFKAPFLKEIVMIDTGGKLSFQKEVWQERRVRPPAEFNLVPFLKGNGIRHINKLILTHDDIDHVGEITTLAKHFKIDTIYIGWELAKAPGSIRSCRNWKKQELLFVKSGRVIGSKVILIFCVVSDYPGEGGE